MDTNQQPAVATQQPDSGTLPDSQLFGVSLRGWILVYVLGAMCIIEIGRFAVLCYLAIQGKDTEALAAAAIREPMYSVILLCVGAYFGKQQKSA